MGTSHEEISSAPAAAEFVFSFSHANITNDTGVQRRWGGGGGTCAAADGSSTAALGTLTMTLVGVRIYYYHTCAYIHCEHKKTKKKYTYTRGVRACTIIILTLNVLVNTCTETSPKRKEESEKIK